MRVANTLQAVQEESWDPLQVLPVPLCMVLCELARMLSTALYHLHHRWMSLFLNCVSSLTSLYNIRNGEEKGLWCVRSLYKTSISFKQPVQQSRILPSSLFWNFTEPAMYVKSFNQVLDMQVCAHYLPWCTKCVSCHFWENKTVDMELTICERQFTSSGFPWPALPNCCGWAKQIDVQANFFGVANNTFLLSKSTRNSISLT